MHAGILNLQSCCEQAEHPKEVVSRHTVRPGSQGLTLLDHLRVSLESACQGVAMLTACVSDPERGECSQTSTSGSPDVHIDPISNCEGCWFFIPCLTDLFLIGKERLFVSMRTVDAAGLSVYQGPRDPSNFLVSLFREQHVIQVSTQRNLH